MISYFFESDLIFISWAQLLPKEETKKRKNLKRTVAISDTNRNRKYNRNSSNQLKITLVNLQILNGVKLRRIKSPRSRTKLT